ncbi:MAG: adenosine kinase [Bacteroidales bacterium]|nr:adenosine kinase [Bacteroidales bacterium]
MKKVLGLGNALVDLLIQMQDDTLIQQLNLPKGSMTLIDEVTAGNISKLIADKKITKASGGSAANTIHGIARLGVTCGYIGKVNNDELGHFFKTDMQNAGINTFLFNGQAGTGRANTFISTDSERTFATYLGAAVELTANELDPAVFAQYDIFHLEGYLVYNTDLIEQALQLARKNNMLVSLDLASYNVVADKIEFLKKIIPQYVDLVFANEEEAKAYTGKSPEEALDIISNECKIAVVKIGKNGSLIKSNGKTHKVGIVKTNALDTTGAGDQYAAGFIYGLNLNLPFDKCGQLGALLAGKVIEKYGARIYEQDWPEIMQNASHIAG